MNEEARQRREPGLSECNRVRRRQHRQQRQQQQDQHDPYSRVTRELPDKQHQTRHPGNPHVPAASGDQ
jgi:hypothetical protein